jgi:hypothetical protein
MNKINHIQIKKKNTKLLFASIAIVVTFALLVSPVVEIGDALAKKHKKNKGNNAAAQK